MSNCRNAGNISSVERDPVFLSQKGKPNGVATLDANGKLPLSQLDIAAIFVEHDPVYNADRGQPDGCATLDSQALVPRAQLGTGTTNNTVFLRGDGTWVQVTTTGGDLTSTRQINTTAPLTGGGDLSTDRTLDISTFEGSGVDHAVGVVPDPGAVRGTNFLREDATWAAIPGGTPGPTGINAKFMIINARGIDGMPDYLEVDPGVGVKIATLKADADNPFEAVVDGTIITFTTDQTIPLVHDDFNAIYLRNDGTFGVRQRPPVYTYSDPRNPILPGEGINIWFDLNTNQIKSWTGAAWEVGVDDTDGGDLLPSLFIGMAHYYQVSFPEVIGLSEPIGLDPYVRFQKFGSGKDGGYFINTGPISTSFVNKEYAYYLVYDGFQQFAFQYNVYVQGPMLMLLPDFTPAVYALNNGCGGAWGGGSGGFAGAGDGVIGTDGGWGGAGGGGGAADAGVSPPTSVNGQGAHGGNHLSRQFFTPTTGAGAPANPIGTTGASSEYEGFDETPPSFLWGGSGGGGGGIGPSVAGGTDGGYAGSGWWSKCASLGFVILGTGFAIHCGGGNAGNFSFNLPNDVPGGCIYGAGGGGGGGVIELLYSVLKVGAGRDVLDVLNVTGGATAAPGPDGFPGTYGGAGKVLLWQI